VACLILVRARVTCCKSLFLHRPQSFERSSLKVLCRSACQEIHHHHHHHPPFTPGNPSLHWHVLNVGKLLPDYTVLQPRRQQSSYSPPWEPQILLMFSTVRQWPLSYQRNRRSRRPSAKFCNMLSSFFYDGLLLSQPTVNWGCALSWLLEFEGSLKLLSLY
jgi:hypothetical protein